MASDIYQNLLSSILLFTEGVLSSSSKNQMVVPSGGSSFLHCYWIFWGKSRSRWCNLNPELRLPEPAPSPSSGIEFYVKVELLMTSDEYDYRV